MNHKYKEGQIVYTLDILYCEGYISSYIIGKYEVCGIECNENTVVYKIKDRNGGSAEDLDWRGRKLEYDLFESKKEIYKYLLEEYETDLNKIRNWYNRKEQFMTDDIKELKQLIKNN